MRESLLQKQQHPQPMSHKGRIAQMLYSSVARQFAAARPYAGSRAAAVAAPAAATAGQPTAAVAVPLLRLFASSSSSSSSINSSSRRLRAIQLKAAYTSDAPAPPAPEAFNGSAAVAEPAPAEMQADAYDSTAAAAMPPFAGQQQPLGPGQAAYGQPGQMMQAAPQQGVLQQQGVPQQQVQQGLSQQQVQQPFMQQQGIQQPPLYAAQQPAAQQQGMPAQGIPGQVFLQAAQGQPAYLQQQAPAAAYGLAMAPGGSQIAGLHATGQMYMQPGAAAAPAAAPPSPFFAQTQGFSSGQPFNGQTAAQGFAPPPPAAAPAQSAPAAAQAPAPTVGPFSDDWVNMVGLTGVVLKGPFLQHFGSTGKVKASLVLGLFARTTGEAVADAPRAILVETWGDDAQLLMQQVQTGTLLFLQGHLALDLRPNERTPSHGPALTVRMESWELVAPDTVPSDRAVSTYRGEYDDVLRMIQGGTAGASSYGGQQQQGQWQQNGTGYQQQPQQAYQRPDVNKHQAMQMFSQGQNIYSIAKALNCGVNDAFRALVDAAEEQGSGSPAWGKLLAFAELLPPQKAPDHLQNYINAVVQAVQQNTQPLTKAGHVRLNAVRDFLLSPQCLLSQELQQQEARKGGKNKTYNQICLLLAMHRAGAF